MSAEGTADSSESQQRWLSVVCLAAIVKNEAQNHGGGIVAYCERILPHVQAAVIVDTGSTDDTVSLLEGLRDRFPWLHVFHHPFDGFAQSRNVSLDLALRVAPTCPYVLLLDADEQLDTYNLSLLARALGCLRAPSDASQVAARVPAVAAGACGHADARQMWDSGPAGPPRADHAAVGGIDTGVSGHLVEDVDTDHSDADDLLAGHDAAQDASHADENVDFEWPAATASSTASGVVPQSAVRPVCLNFRIECVNAASQPAHRANSGLMNPRVFPNTPHFRFVNKIALRWERLLFNGHALPASFMSRPGVTFFHYIPPVSGRKEKNKAYRKMDDEPWHQGQTTAHEIDHDDYTPSNGRANSSHSVSTPAAGDPSQASVASPRNQPRPQKKAKVVLTGMHVCMYKCTYVCCACVVSILCVCVVEFLLHHASAREHAYE
jgi:glycosyltransferase involved in cell wall biosynthesis